MTRSACKRRRHEMLGSEVAGRLEEMAALLEQRGANPFRVGAYRRAAETLRQGDFDLATLVEREGVDGLAALPNVGRGIVAAVYEMVATGR